MKTKSLLLIAVLTAAIQFKATAQTNAPMVAPEVYKNTAVIPVPRTGSITNRQSQVLQRAKEATGQYDLEFIGDSITQGWEGAGKNVWKEFYGQRRTLNFGVGGDQTQHVLWRFENGQLAGVKAKVAIVMIGTNNSGKNKDGTDSYTDEDILAGVTAIVQQIRARQPETKVLLLGIFPRAKAFSPQRGKLLQVNQALEKLDDGKQVFYLDLGSKLIENDGTISKKIMPDALHPNDAGYRIWASAMEPKLKELLGEK